MILYPGRLWVHKCGEFIFIGLLKRDPLEAIIRLTHLPLDHGGGGKEEVGGGGRRGEEEGHEPSEMVLL